MTTLSPTPGWILCRLLEPTYKGKIQVMHDLEKDTVSEAVAVVVDPGPGDYTPNGKMLIPSQFKKGDKILFKGWLRKQAQVGDILGEDQHKLFMLKSIDAMMILDENDVANYFGEYEEFKV